MQRPTDFAPPNDQFAINLGNVVAPAPTDRTDEEDEVSSEKTQSVEDLFEPDDETPEMSTKIPEIQTTFSTDSLNTSSIFSKF